MQLVAWEFVQALPSQSITVYFVQPFPVLDTSQSAHNVSLIPVHPVMLLT